MIVLPIFEQTLIVGRNAYLISRHPFIDMPGKCVISAVDMIRSAQAVR